MEKKIGLIFADEMEYIPFLRLVAQYAGQESVSRGKRAAAFTLEKNGRALRLCGVECGIGKVCAATTAAYLIAEEKVDLILNAGLSGAISGLRRGDFVAGTSFRECDFDLTPLGRPLGIQLSAQNEREEKAGGRQQRERSAQDQQRDPFLLAFTPSHISRCPPALPCRRF